MKKNSSLTNKILAMVCLTAVLICVCVTVIGATMIYASSKNGIKNEISFAARTLYNFYDELYHGEYHIDGDKLVKGSTVLTEENFNDIIYIIDCDRDIDFTIFWNDVRILTSVTNDDGSLAIGTKAAEPVVQQVLNDGMEFYYNRVMVNGRQYIGYYIPIMDSSAKAVGMVFAGKPLDKASESAKDLIGYFLIICLVILVVSVAIFSAFSHRIIASLFDIKKYMESIAECDFSTALGHNTVARSDEIGDIARSAEKLRDNLQDLIERDPLTSLLNRRSCRKIMDDLKAKDIPFAVVMGDIDFFKKVNDTYGHAAGDMVLKEVSAILNRSAESASGYASRWGGEEFLIVLPRLNMNETEELINSLMNDIRAKEFTSNDKIFSVTMTLGAAEVQPPESIEDAVGRADRLLYDGKRMGRNRLVMQ